MKEVPGPNEKMQVIETINCNGLSLNNTLMNINFEILHYQWIPFSYYSVNLMLYVQPLEAIISIIAWVEILVLNYCYSISDLRFTQQCVKV